MATTEEMKEKLMEALFHSFPGPMTSRDCVIEHKFRNQLEMIYEKTSHGSGCDPVRVPVINARKD